MTNHVLIPHKLLDSAEAALDDAFTVHRLYDAPDRDAMLAEVGPQITAIANGGGVGRDMIEALPNLKLVAHFGVGYDPVDVAACRDQGVSVTNTPDVLNDAVAEMTLGLMLALERRIVQADGFVRAGKWESGGYGLTGELTGKTAGIMGLGRIGKEVARRLQAMKMNVVYHGRTEQRHEPFPYYASLKDMAAASDWLIVIVPGTAETRQAVNADVLKALGPSGALLNIGRGTVVDEAALIACLQDGSLGGAALDVLEDEPKVPDALRGMDNVVLQPHQGSATHKTRWAMGDLVVRNIKAHFAGQPLISQVV